MKLAMTHCAMVKEGIDSGRLKTWGINSGGTHGFAITDTDEKEIFAGNARYIPYVKFRVESMLSIDKVIEILKTSQQQG